MWKRKISNHTPEFTLSSTHINSKECLEFILGKLNIKGMIVHNKYNKLFQFRNYKADTEGKSFFAIKFRKRSRLLAAWPLRIIWTDEPTEG